jgi:hypothetical protein
MPFRLSEYGAHSFRPQPGSDVVLYWRIVNWLDGSPEWQPFLELFQSSKKLKIEEIDFLYPTLVRIPVEYITSAASIFLPTVGPVLHVEYHYPEDDYKGVMRFALSHTGPQDVQIISYEGSEPLYGSHILEALNSLDSLRQLQNYDATASELFLTPREFQKLQQEIADARKNGRPDYVKEIELLGWQKRRGKVKDEDFDKKIVDLALALYKRRLDAGDSADAVHTQSAQALNKMIKDLAEEAPERVRAILAVLEQGKRQINAARG